MLRFRSSMTSPSNHALSAIVGPGLHELDSLFDKVVPPIARLDLVLNRQPPVPLIGARPSDFLRLRKPTTLSSSQRECRPQQEVLERPV